MYTLFQAIYSVYCKGEGFRGPEPKNIGIFQIEVAPFPWDHGFVPDFRQFIVKSSRSQLIEDYSLKTWSSSHLILITVHEVHYNLPALTFFNKIN